MNIFHKRHILIVLYAIFIYWYGGLFQHPLNEIEIKEIEEKLLKFLPKKSPDFFINFAKKDDGNAFLMVNLNKYKTRNNNNNISDGRDLVFVESLKKNEMIYKKNMLSRMIKRACHPMVAGSPIQAFQAADEYESYDTVAVVRYRSRRDFFALVLNQEWADNAIHKFAALEIANSFPVKPLLLLPGMRIVVLILCLAVAYFL